MQKALPEAVEKETLLLSLCQVLNSTYDWSIKSAVAVTINP